MKKNSLTGKSTRTKIFTVITVCSIILLLALNIFLTGFGIFGNAYIDMTPEGLYTLRDKMVDACQEIFYTEDGNLRDPGIKITFCDDPDNLIADTPTRIIYYMAIALSKKFDNCEVETVNVAQDPTAVAQYRTTSLTEIKTTDVIVSYGSRYSIASAESFWRVGSDNVVYSFDGEYKLASMMLSLTLVNKPTAYFVTDHGEEYYDTANVENPINKRTGAFASLLYERGMNIKTLEISKLIEEAERKSAEIGKIVEPSIPEDCVLLIINNPQTDFVSDSDKLGSFSYVSETEILDRYMTEERGSIMVAKDYRITLPNFEDFLAEWGISFTETLVKDKENHVENDEGTDTTIIADYNLGEETYAYTIYGDFASMTSAPKVIINDTGAIKSGYGDSVATNENGSLKTTRIYAPFLYSSVSAEDFGLDAQGNYDAIAGQGKKVIAAVGGRQTIDGNTSDMTYSYVFCSASRDFFSSDFLGNPSYANNDVVAALVQNIARLETHADTALGGLSLNNGDAFGGKMLVKTSIRDKDEYEKGWDEYGNRVIIATKKGLTAPWRVAYTVIVFVLPVAIAVIGIVIHLKRRYL